MSWDSFVLFLACLESLILAQNCLPQFNTLYDISYSSQQNQFVIVGSCGDGPGGQKVYTSTDNGNTWNSNSAWQLSSVWELSSVAFGGSKPQWVSVGGVACIVTSPDGKTWSLDSNNGNVTNYFFHLIRWFPETQLFLTGASFGTILSSTDGNNWLNARPHVQDGQEMYSFAYSNGTYVAVGGALDDGSDGPVVFSTNATAWIAGVAPFPVYLQDVTYGAGKFVAVGSYGNYPQEYCSIISSSDGETWQSVFNCSRPGKETGLTGICWSQQSGFVAVGKAILVSKDGVSWKTIPKSQYPNPIDDDVHWLNGVTCSPRIIAVGNSNFVWISDDVGQHWKQAKVIG